MKLKTNELKSFFRLADSISVNNIIPILQYVQLTDGCLIKTNLRTFVSHRISAPQSESLLLDEKVLGAFLRECKSDEIEVKKDGNNVWLIEGKRKMKFQSADEKDYPVFPKGDKEDSTLFTADELDAIGKAAKNVGSVGGNETLDFVHIFGGYVVGTDRTKFYCKKFDKLPDLILDTESANIISKFESVVFYQSGKYNFFEIGNTLYGFIQAEVKTPNIIQFIPKEQPKEFLELSVAEFTGFCDTVTSASPSKVLDCELNGNHLSFKDADYDIDYDLDLDTSGDFKPKTYFLPRVFGGFMKTLGVEKVKLADAGLKNPALSVWSDDDPAFRGLVIGTIPQQ